MLTLQGPVFRIRACERLRLEGWGQMWDIEGCVSLSSIRGQPSVVERDLETIGQNSNILKGHPMASVQVQPALEPRIYGWHDLVLGLGGQG